MQISPYLRQLFSILNTRQFKNKPKYFKKIFCLHKIHQALFLGITNGFYMNLANTDMLKHRSDYDETKI